MGGRDSPGVACVDSRVTASALPRRTLLAGSAAGALAGALPAPARASSSRPDPYFGHGVASGDPWPTAVVLWTRVTPTAAATPGSGRGPVVEVGWQVARDRDFDRVVRAGSVTTGPGRDHTVKVDATGLEPATTYYYRFHFGRHRSRVGTTRTAPRPGDRLGRLRLGVVSCSNWQAGYFSAYRHLAARDDLDLVLHLGDYIYEYAPGGYGYGQSNVDIRRHQPAREMVTLADYRQRHAQYKTDPDLADLHAKTAWATTWDDHEVTNDAYRRGAENHDPATEGDYLDRRRRAYRAYDEWMPVRMSGTAALGNGARLYRGLRFGQLAELSLLDLRTYRNKQVGADLAGIDRADRTITGDAQMRWLKHRLARTEAQWKLVGNPVMIAPVRIPALPERERSALEQITGPPPQHGPDGGVPYNVDQWDGYTADRRELLRHLADRGITDTVFLTGDIHSAWACDLPRDTGTYPISRSVATELVCTSVTSNNLDDILGSPPRTASLAVEAAVQAGNRHVRYVNLDDHGYSVLDVTPARVQMDYFAIGDRANRKAGSRRVASWAVATGTQQVAPVEGPIR